MEKITATTMIKRVTLTRSLRVAILALTGVIRKMVLIIILSTILVNTLMLRITLKTKNIVVNINEISRERDQYPGNPIYHRD